MSAPELTWGFCVVCTRYGQGRYVGPIGDRAEAIDDHKGCSGERPPVAEQPRRHHAER